MIGDVIAENDVLRTGAETSLCEFFVAAGTVCKLSTNSESILEAARETFIPIAARPAHADLDFRFWVDPGLTSGPPWPKPYFRGLDHLVYAGFDGENSLLMDLRRRRAIGRFSPAMARDSRYWKVVVLPALFGIASGAVGAAAIHCGCVGEKSSGDGIILAGPSGSGKSTLAYAMARRGYAFLCDDWAFVTSRSGVLQAWSVTATAKLLPDAAAHFPELAGMVPVRSFNGEIAYEIVPGPEFGVRRFYRCVPRWVIFLERRETACFEMSELPASATAARLQMDLERLPGSFSGSRKLVIETIEILARQKSWLLRYGGQPDDIVDALVPYLEGKRPVPGAAPPDANPPYTESPDLLRRFVQVPYRATISSPAAKIRLETDSPRILGQVRDCCGTSGAGSSAKPSFEWKLLGDPEAGRPSSPPCIVSDSAVHFMNIAQRSFVAVDAEARQAHGVVPESLLDDSRAFREGFLAPLLQMTEDALRTPESRAGMDHEGSAPYRIPAVT